MEAHSIPEGNPFSASEAKFGALVKRMGSDEVLALEHGPLEDTAATLSHDTGAPVPKRQVKEMCEGLAADFDAYHEGRNATPVRDEASLLVLSFDGTGVHMRPEALREQTRKPREAMLDEEQWPSPTARGPKRNNGTRSATVSVCYEIEPYPRTFQDILRDLRGLQSIERAQARSRPKPEAKRVSASLDKSVRQVVRKAFADARRRDPNHDKRCLVLLDGNEHQLDAVQAQARALGMSVTIIIVLIHVAGYVWAAAKVLRPDDFARASSVGHGEAHRHPVGSRRRRRRGHAPQRVHDEARHCPARARRRLRGLPPEIPALHGLRRGSL